MVNINDMKFEGEIPKNIIKAIFEKQKTLMKKYKEIENMPLFIVEGDKNNIDTAEGQKWIKDFSWRITEEICEAIEAKCFAYKKMKEKRRELIEKNSVKMIGFDAEKEVRTYKEFDHYLEEITDALHFMTELCIICGYEWEDMNNIIVLTSNEMDVIYNLGLAMNCLKNKPWKQSQMLTDRPKFREYIQKTYTGILGIYKFNEYYMDAIYILYFKKNAVNQFRQRSKY